MKVDINNPVVVAILSIPVFGLLLYLLLKEQLEKERQSGNSQFTKSLPSCSHENNNRVLVLCINATKEDVLQSLGMNRRVMANSCEELYRATKYLWIGTETAFSESPLENWFSIKYSISDDERSEYDVNLVQIHLNRHDPGFEPNVTSIKRLDAFLGLPNNSGEVKVSPRLPCKAYEKILYSR